MCMHVHVHKYIYIYLKEELKVKLVLVLQSLSGKPLTGHSLGNKFLKFVFHLDHSVI